jgi:hypothetical protein
VLRYNQRGRRHKESVGAGGGVVVSRDCPIQSPATAYPQPSSSLTPAPVDSFLAKVSLQAEDETLNNGGNFTLVSTPDHGADPLHGTEAKDFSFGRLQSACAVGVGTHTGPLLSRGSY